MAVGAGIRQFYIELALQDTESKDEDELVAKLSVERLIMRQHLRKLLNALDDYFLTKTQDPAAKLTAIEAATNLLSVYHEVELQPGIDSLRTKPPTDPPDTKSRYEFIEFTPWPPQNQPKTKPSNPSILASSLLG